MKFLHFHSSEANSKSLFFNISRLQYLTELISSIKRYSCIHKTKGYYYLFACGYKANLLKMCDFFSPLASYKFFVVISTSSEWIAYSSTQLFSSKCNAILITGKHLIYSKALLFFFLYIAHIQVNTSQKNAHPLKWEMVIS